MTQLFKFLICIALFTTGSASTVFAHESTWSCSSMCGTVESYHHVYGTGPTALEAFRRMERSCRPPSLLFINWQPATSCYRGNYTFASLQNACVADVLEPSSSSASF